LALGRATDNRDDNLMCCKRYPLVLASSRRGLPCVGDSATACCNQGLRVRRDVRPGIL